MRTEKDSLGPLEIPDTALYGASTQRAVLNFPVSGRPLPPRFVHALGLLKYACACANERLGLLPPDVARLIRAAALEIRDGRLDAHFPVDVFQTGSATSTNTNANEVISNRACQIAGTPIGSKTPVHPNDHANLGQSSNDTMPTTLHIAVSLALRDDLLPALDALAAALDAKAQAWSPLVKVGRTHLMDATPLTLGQEFSGYAAQAHAAATRARKAVVALEEVALGGTAVGTGLNCHPGFTNLVLATLNAETGLSLREAQNHFEAQGARDASVEVAGLLTAIAAGLTKIANDIRLLGSGPRSGLAEISLPATQPGSSIMPGKVNPVMPEMLVQTCLYVFGLCHTTALCGRDGHFELNTTIPLIAYALLDSISCLANATRTFTERCVIGLQANAERCRENVERSLMLVTALNPLIGYDRAAHVAKRAFAENRTLREIVLEEKLLEPHILDAALDPARMTRHA